MLLLLALWTPSGRPWSYSSFRSVSWCRPCALHWTYSYRSLMDAPLGPLPAPAASPVFSRRLSDQVLAVIQRCCVFIIRDVTFSCSGEGRTGRWMWNRCLPWRGLIPAVCWCFTLIVYDSFWDGPWCSASRAEFHVELAIMERTKAIATRRLPINVITWI